MIDFDKYIGKKYGKLTILKRTKNDKYNLAMFECLCDCGNKKTIRLTALKCKKTKSCGCLQIEKVKTHGLKGTVEYRAWGSMKDRCNNKNNKRYKNYGERGIVICERWNNSFINFISDMGFKPFKGAQLDRINNNGNYEPDNCRWTDRFIQANNKRNNRIIEFNGKKQNLTQWANELNMFKQNIIYRINHNWGIEKTLTTPVRYKSR